MRGAQKLLHLACDAHVVCASKLHHKLSKGGCLSGEARIIIELDNVPSILRELT